MQDGFYGASPCMEHLRLLLERYMRAIAPNEIPKSVDHRHPLYTTPSHLAAWFTAPIYPRTHPPVTSGRHIEERTSQVQCVAATSYVSGWRRRPLQQPPE